MTDITSILTRIREIATEGANSDATYDDLIRYQTILLNLNFLKLEGIMNTDTTDEAQWWFVKWDNGVWCCEPANGHAHTISAMNGGSSWSFTVRVQCPPNATEHDIYQAAVDAWADAGFAHAPKEPPGPRQVEGWAWVRTDPSPASGVTVLRIYDSEASARHRHPACLHESDFRIVRVDATVSEVEQ